MLLPFPVKNIIHSYLLLYEIFEERNSDDNFNPRNIISFSFNNNKLNLLSSIYIYKTRNKTRISNGVNLPISLKFTPSFLSIHEIMIRTGIFQ